MIYEFGENDQFVNTVVAYPRYETTLYNNSIYLNQFKTEGNAVSQSLSLKGENIGGTWLSNSILLNGGDVISQIYPPITGSYFKRYYVIVGSDGTLDSHSDLKGKYILSSLAASMKYYSSLSPSYAMENYFTSSGATLKPSMRYNIISLPSILYGTKINPGTVELKCYVTGTLVSYATDSRKNGEIVCQSPASLSGTVLGVIFYSEGYLVLTASATIASSCTENFIMPTNSVGSPSTDSLKWQYFGSFKNTTNDSSKNISSSSFVLNYEGINKIPTRTMFMHLPRNDLTWSNNITFMSSSYISSSFGPNYFESEIGNNIHNMKYSGISNYSGSFESHSFISQVILLDKQKKAIGVISLGRNTQKRDKDQYTIKTQLDF